MTTAIYYTSVRAAPGREGQIFGLQIAISDWMKAYFRYSKTDKFNFLIGHEIELADIKEIATQTGLDEKRLIVLDRRYPEENYSTFDNVFRPEPGTRNMLWLRQSAPGFSFCGLAHAISGMEAGEVLEEYCLSPSEPTDAIICPSLAVQSAVRTFWASYGDYLDMRFGAKYTCPVQLPVIPLGIDIEKFERRVTPDKRAAQRSALGIDEDEVVVLWIGRLSAAIKAHPLAMFQAAERAAENTDRKVRLLMVGYFVPDEAEGQFKNLASDVCKKATVTFVDAHDARFPEGLWAAGDIFLSLIDNIQESFGLTPIEAMAAGLPRVVSDWDGYRDSVTDGEDGFLIRTSQPPVGAGFDLTTQVASGREIYGGFLAKTALTVAVDAEQAGDRLTQLIRDPNLRAFMAERARARVKAHYDWRQIIPAYEALWSELATKRKATLPSMQKWKGAIPQLPDPYTMYETYPSRRLNETDKISLALPVDKITLLLKHDINTFAHDLLISSDEISMLVGALGKMGAASIAAIFGHFPTTDRPRLWRTIAWLQKLGIIKNF